MKKLSVIAILATTLIVAAGCGKSEEEMKYLKDFKASDYVELCDYKGLTADVEKAEVTDEEMQQYIDYLLAYYTEEVEITDRDVAKEGDIANIDYVGTLNGVAFEGGTAEGYNLRLGSGQFIDGFEAGVVGMKVGDTKELELTFPETYGNEELAGKDVIFTVTLNQLKEEKTPELNDEFVQGMSQQFSTVDEFKAQMRSDMLNDEIEKQKDDAYNQFQKYILENSTFKDAPSGFVDRMYDSLVKSLQDTASQSGTDVGTVASYYYGVSADNYEAELKDYVKNSIAKQYIMLAAIAEKENITVSEDDVNAMISKTLEDYGSTYSIEDYKKMIGDLEAYSEFIITEKVMDLIMENAIINEQ